MTDSETGDNTVLVIEFVREVSFSLQIVVS